MYMEWSTSCFQKNDGYEVAVPSIADGVYHDLRPSCCTYQICNFLLVDFKKFVVR